MQKIPLVKPHLPNLEDIQNELRQILESGRLTNFGPFSQCLERKICDKIGVKHAICVANATTGLMLLLNTLPKNSEVLVPSFTFLPTVQAILWNSLQPVFVDIDPTAYTISPRAAIKKINNKTSAILAVHTFGNPCAMDELEDLAGSNGIRLFYDSAHAFGAQYDNQYVGNFGEAEVFSLSATKTLPCGEGGVITTNSDSLYHEILNRRNYGFNSKSDDCANMGLNGKITEFSAILGIKEIDSIDTEVQTRNNIAMKYINGLKKIPGISFQNIRHNDIATYKDFTIVIEEDPRGWNRNELNKSLLSCGIETKPYFSPAIHQMQYFKHGNFDTGELKNTEAIENKILSLPIYYDLSDIEIGYIIKSIKRSFRSRADYHDETEAKQGVKYATVENDSALIERQTCSACY